MAAALTGPARHTPKGGTGVTRLRCHGDALRNTRLLAQPSAEEIPMNSIIYIVGLVVVVLLVLSFLGLR